MTTGARDDRVFKRMMAIIMVKDWQNPTLTQFDKWVDRVWSVTPTPSDMSDTEEPEPESPEPENPERVRTAPLKISLKLCTRASAPVFVWPDGSEATYESLGAAVRDLKKRKFVTNSTALGRSLSSVGSVGGHKPVRPVDAAGKRVKFWVFSA